MEADNFDILDIFDDVWFKREAERVFAAKRHLEKTVVEAFTPLEHAPAQSPWAYLLPMGERDVDDSVAIVGEALRSVVRIIRGQRCSTRKLLFQEWAAALQFPYYFGENWDAFEECMADLAWLPRGHRFFFVTNVDRILRDKQDFRQFIDSLRSASEQQGVVGGDDGEQPYRIIFHCEPKRLLIAQRRLAEAQTTVPVLSYH